MNFDIRLSPESQVAGTEFPVDGLYSPPWSFSEGGGTDRWSGIGEVVTAGASLPGGGSGGTGGGNGANGVELNLPDTIYVRSGGPIVTGTTVPVGSQVKATGLERYFTNRTSSPITVADLSMATLRDSDLVEPLSEIFDRGFIQAVDHGRFNVRITGDTRVAERIPDRYVQIATPLEGTTQMEFLLEDDALTEIDRKTVNVVSRTLTNPSSMERILCVGDSLTDADIWPSRLRDNIAHLSNYEFIGTKSGNAPYDTPNEGESGKEWDWFATDPASPLQGNDFAGYASTNGYASIDHLIVLLSHNGFQDNGNFIDGFISRATDMIDAVTSDFPSVRILLMGLQIPSLNGGLGNNYGNDNSNRNPYGSLRTVFELNNRYEALAATRSNCTFVNVSAMFDTQWNYAMQQVRPNLNNATAAKVEWRGTNGVHPDHAGYLQIGDLVTGYLGI